MLVKGIATDKLALGFFGFAYYEENKDELKLVPIDDGDKDNGDGADRSLREDDRERHLPAAVAPDLHLREQAPKPTARKCRTSSTTTSAQGTKLVERGRLHRAAREAYELATRRASTQRTTGSVFAGAARRSASRWRTCSSQESESIMQMAPPRSTRTASQQRLARQGAAASVPPSASSKRCCVASGLVSVLTTAGILFVLAFETFALLPRGLARRVPDWHRVDAAVRGRAFGILPLLCGTLLTSAIAIAVALPFGLLAAIYLSEFAPSVGAPRAQAHARAARRACRPSSTATSRWCS